MTQQDTPVRLDESDEVRALRALARIAGWCVTSTTGGTHSRTSLHYAKATNGKGRAVDLASKVRPNDTAGLIAINEQIIQLVPLSMISELIYAGGVCVKNGHVVDGMATYGATTLANHENHNHLAVTLGFTYQGGSPMPADDPTIPNIRGPVELHVVADANGHATGYYIFSPSSGEIHAWGEGAVFYGRSEVVT